MLIKPRQKWQVQALGSFSAKVFLEYLQVCFETFKNLKIQRAYLRGLNMTALVIPVAVIKYSGKGNSRGKGQGLIVVRGIFHNGLKSGKRKMGCSYTVYFLQSL